MHLEQAFDGGLADLADSKVYWLLKFLPFCAKIDKIHPGRTHMTKAPSVSDMISQSRDILSKPSVATFERFENKGSMREALIYVALAAALTGVLGLVTGGLMGFLNGIVSTLIGFFVFTYLVYWIGKQQGGTGTFDQVAYTFALFWAPLAVLFGAVSLLLVITLIGIFLLPLVAIVALVANIYFAYLGVQSSMNISAGGKAWLTLILAALGTFVVNIVLSGILFRR
jgi:hypothetical protein